MTLSQILKRKNRRDEPYACTNIMGKFLPMAETTILSRLHDYSFRENGHKGYLMITILPVNAKALQEMFDVIFRLQKSP